MKEHLQKNTAGGAVSANIDATRQANTEVYKAKQAENAGNNGGDSTENGAAASSGEDSGGTISSGSGDRGMPALNNGQGDGSGLDAYDPGKIGLPDS